MRGLTISLQTHQAPPDLTLGNTRGACSVVASFPGLATTWE